MQLFVVYTRYLIGGAFIFAAPIKMKGHRFIPESGASQPIDSAWHLFETLYQSDIYWSFLGVGQLIAGGLLMTQRYSKLGAIVYFPIITNIFIITISYVFPYTPVVTGLMLLANLMLFVWDWESYRVLVNRKPIQAIKNYEEDKPIWVIIGIALFSFIFLYRWIFDNYATTQDIIYVGSGFLIIATLGLFIGLRKVSHP